MRGWLPPCGAPDGQGGGDRARARAGLHRTELTMGRAEAAGCGQPLLWRRPHPKPTGCRPPPDAASQGDGVGRGARQQRAAAPPMAKACWTRRTCLLFFWDFFMLQLLYISVVIVFLTCCNRSSSRCNHFSFMFAKRCTHVAFVFLRCCKCLM
jgi:hypothetical protein